MLTLCIYVYSHTTQVESKQKQTRETDIQTDRQTDRQIDRHIFVDTYLHIIPYGLNDKILREKKRKYIIIDVAYSFSTRV